MSFFGNSQLKDPHPNNLTECINNQVDCDSIFGSDEIDQPSGHPPIDWVDLTMQLKVNSHDSPVFFLLWQYWPLGMSQNDKIAE